MSFGMEPPYGMNLVRSVYQPSTQSTLTDVLDKAVKLVAYESFKEGFGDLQGSSCGLMEASWADAYPMWPMWPVIVLG